MADKRAQRTPKREQAVLDELRAGRSVSAACRVAGIGRSTYYQWRDDPVFAAAADDAVEEGTDLLEDTAIKRATDPEHGSDTLLIFLLKARRAEKYRDNSTVRYEGENGGPMRIELIGINAEDI